MTIRSTYKYTNEVGETWRSRTIFFAVSTEQTAVCGVEFSQQ